MTPRPVHYVASTHWDREWYQTFQNYRYRLVQLLDKVIAGLQENRLQGPFTTDGQVVMLEDYVEVRPERRTLVEQLAREGKIQAGPWYVMPDEFMVSGESLVRNLRLGRETVRAMGAKPSDAGFVCDIFGHNSQMPQILGGFGIPMAFLWRGLNHVEGRNLLWRGADGTTIPIYRFGKIGYCSFACQVRQAFNVEREFHEELAEGQLDQYLQEEVAATQVDPILLFDGCDHQEWDEQLYPLLVKRINSDQGAFAWHHGTLDDYIADLLPQADRITDVVAGELREPALHRTEFDQQWLIAGVISSRVWINQWNAACQTKLCHWAEPASALASLALGREYPAGFLNIAWRWLIRNHPHDSICGCSIDAVHEDMKFRFHQCEDIADRLTTEATTSLAANVAGDLAADEVRVCVFNPLARELDEPATLMLQIPTDWVHFCREMGTFEPLPGFRIYGADGVEVPYQRLRQTLQSPKLTIVSRGLHSYHTNDIEVALPLRLPAMGYTTLTVRQAEPGEPTHHPLAKGLATSECAMENDLVRVVIEPNGTLTVTDQTTGQTYERLLTFEDMADIGDGWNHGAATNDQTFVSRTARADLALVHDGPLLTTFRVRTTLAVPRAFAFDRTMARTEAFTDLIIDSLMTLRAGVGRVEVETTVHNTAQDHRLRVLFPTGADTDTYLADTPFDVVKRSIALRADNYVYRELEIETKPQQSWTAAFDAQRGLAIVSGGLLESAVRDQPERPIALTLFRSTRRTVMTAGEPNGQLLGDLHFRYWIVPLGGAPDRVRLCALGQQLGAGLRDSQVTAFDLRHHRTTGDLPAESGLFAVKGDAVVTSARLVADGLELRLFNPTESATPIVISLGEVAKRFTQYQRVNLESAPLGEPERIQRKRVKIELGAKEIVTVRLS